MKLPEHVALTVTQRDPQIIGRVARYEFAYAILGLTVGLICIVLGLVLFLHGAQGTTSWTARLLGLQTDVTDAAPGVMFGLVGLFVIFVSRYRFMITASALRSGPPSVRGPA